MNFQNKKAILYKRVSTDEQAGGYSLADQDERLHKFCQIWDIQIIQLFQDDYSAKSFDRPGWNQLTQFIKRKAANLLLFTNWSRFSRAENMGETYMMIDRLFRLGMEVQAIEQPLDLTIPENRLVLAFYIASPMVENLRRASNTINGIRKSYRTGRWCNKAPFGYQNTQDEQSRPTLAINNPQAQIIEAIFLDYLKGDDPKVIIRRAREKGLTVQGHSTFPKIIGNPLYAGLIRLRAYKGESEQIIKALHEKIISEEIWWAANQKYKEATTPKPKLYSEDFPLRGILSCEACNHTFTGGRSRGRHGKYFNYYRCLYCKGQNYRAETAHQELSEILSAISLKQKYIDLFTESFENDLKFYINKSAEDSVKLRKEITSLEEKLQSLESKYIENKIAFDTYDKYYPIIRAEIANKRMHHDQISTGKTDLLDLYRQALPKMKNLDFLYLGLDVEMKQELLRLMFVSGLYKTKTGYRTPTLISIFDPKAATDAGLTIGDNILQGTIMLEIEDSRLSGNEIEPLLLFILKVAA